jgi:hypothetical protein
MMRQTTCIHGASSRLLDSHGVARDLRELCKHAACIKFERWRGLTGTCGGAYGVVGLSGVKDARKSVLIADASASAGLSAGPVQFECGVGATQVLSQGMSCTDLLRNHCDS